MQASCKERGKELKRVFGAGWTDLKTRKRREKGRWQQKREEGGGETIAMESRLGWEAASLKAGELGSPLPTGRRTTFIQQRAQLS
jgi:hypothetical protein